MTCMMAILGAAFLASSFSMRMETRQEQSLVMPSADANGRFETFNRMGYVDPTTDDVVDEYVEWTVDKARKAPPGSDYLHQKHALEIGGGFGFVAARAVQQGAYYILNDAEPRHLEIAKALVLPDDQHDSQTFCLPGFFPKETNLSSLRYFPVVSVGGFKFLHFLRGSEIREFFDTVYDILEPGGRAFFTAITPYNGLLKGYQAGYRGRKHAFFRDPIRNPFPGEIADVWQYFPKDKYPAFFHALDGDILSYIATQMNPSKAFKVIRVSNIQRPSPSNQAYRRGYRFGHTEVVGIVLEKLQP